MENEAPPMTVNAKLLEALKRLYRAYVSLLETGRDHIVAHGGACDPVSRMEEDDPFLAEARAAIAEAAAEGDGWRSIESAPKDGTVFLSWGAHDTFPVATCWDRPNADYDDGSHRGIEVWGPSEDGSCWVFADWLLHDEGGPITPTHWRPLPAPPVLGEG